jgi:CubicO group peptidase (beta-lactamase class C family)
VVSRRRAWRRLRWTIWPIALAIAFSSACSVARWIPERAPRAGDARVAAVLERARLRERLPGAVAVRASEGAVVDRAAVGFRSLASLEAFLPQDAVHLGSAAKAMTATLVATYVETGHLRWRDPLTELFPGVSVHAGYRTATLEDLATHFAGLPRDPTGMELRRLAGSGDARAQRRALSLLVLSSPPEHEVGSRWAYSNVGYMLLGAVLERFAGEPFEVLLAKRVFAPLGMHRCGLHAPGQSIDAADPPRGHRHTGAVMPPGAAGDLSPLYSPAGLVHCPLGDWLRFVQDQSDGESGQGALLSAEHYRRLHHPVRGGNYAFGWTVRTTEDGPVLGHAGSNGYLRSVVQLEPRLNRIVLFATNVGGVDDRALRRVLLDLDALPWPRGGFSQRP